MADFIANLSLFWCFVIVWSLAIVAAGVLALLGRAYDFVMRTYFDAY